LSFDVFYAECKDRVFRAVIASTGDTNDAEDCTAEAFARCYTQWAVVSLHPAPQAWVARTAINIHIDKYRRGQRLLHLLPRISASATVDPPPPPIDETLMTALRRLPDRQREVIALRVLLGLSGQETATELGISVGSVGTHLHRGLAAVRPVVSRAEAHIETELSS
jgi:RNA polymerase sigma factor (sigma-70 family)